MIGISSCLIGMNCTYSAKNNLVVGLKRLYEKGEVIEVCPEVLGGLLTPREPAEIICRDPLKIETINHKDVTLQYQEGAKKALDVFLENDIQVAILKFRSPSCGNEGVYDGTFQHKLINGKGIFVQMLEENGVQVFNENQIDEFLKYIGKEEEYGAYFKD